MKLYRHYKTGHFYRIIGRATHTETEEVLVLYQMCNTSGEIQSQFPVWARPTDLFYGKAEKDGKLVDRFELCSFYDDYGEEFHA